MIKKCQQCGSYKMMLFVTFLLTTTFLLHKYCSFLTIEGMDNYESMKPSINVLYKDQSGIEISDLGKYGRCLIIENEVQLCEKQEHIYHEMIVHFPVMYLKNPLKNVVIIGGGDLMTLREVMKYYTIEKVFMLELDPTIVDLCEKHFNQSKYEDDQRVEIIYGDANDTIDTILKNHEEDIDLVIVDTTEDNTNNTSVDSPKFFTKCFDLLNNNGVVVKNGLFFKDMFETFDNTHIIPYNVNIPYFQEKYKFTIASNQENNIREVELQIDNWNDYEIKTKYYKPGKHINHIIYEEYNEVK
jgi:spermidine synthase